MKNLIGYRFGKLTVVKQLESNKRGEKVWLCKCECGKEKTAKTYNLTSKKITHCGCSKKCKRDDSIIGQKFGRLTVLAFSHTYRCRSSIWECLCECGNVVFSKKHALVHGRTKSCGCYNKETQRKRLYNPDVPDEVRIMTRICKEYKNWVKAVKKKYNDQCDICSSNKQLVAHHIKNYLDNISLRFNVDNGVCLCKKCHTKFHAKYGLHNNTPRQYCKFRKDNNE